jgi:hypothetical protein
MRDGAHPLACEVTSIPQPGPDRAQSLTPFTGSAARYRPAAPSAGRAR